MEKATSKFIGKNKFDKFIVGFIVGLIAPFIVFFIYYKMYYDFLNFNAYVVDAFMKNVFTPLLSLCVIVNLGIFYFCYWKYYNYAARGIIGATFVYALIVLLLKFVL